MYSIGVILFFDHAVIIEDEKELYADRGYAPSRKMMKEKYPQIVDKIMYKRQRGKKGSKYVDLDVFEFAEKLKIFRKLRGTVSSPVVCYPAHDRTVTHLALR